MWNKRKSSFLIIRLSLGGLKRFAFPVTLFVLDITINAIADLALVADLFFPLWSKRACQKHISDKPAKIFIPRVPVSMIIMECIGLIDELRRHGRWQVVKVESGNVRVNIDLW